MCYLFENVAVPEFLFFFEYFWENLSRFGTLFDIIVYKSIVLLFLQISGSLKNLYLYIMTQSSQFYFRINKNKALK